MTSDVRSAVLVCGGVESVIASTFVAMIDVR
jgi:hypothetical protein